ncbi:MAG: hypothetical protein QOH16_332 [Gaiellaceae bacterium]|jgi:uncharacterized protein (DUF697 family)|nr:hypothetical protein [Gaiellaceae bacterium]
MSGRKLGPLALFSLVREVRRGSGDQRPLAVAGARELLPIIARQLREGGDPSAVAEGRVENAAALLWVGPPDEEALRTADRAGVPIIAVTDADQVPYVLATDIVRVPPGEGFPIDAIAHAVARKLGEDGTALAARLPVLRRAVCDELIRSFSKKNAIVSAAVFIPGVDMPVLTLNQARLVLRIALAYGQEIDKERAVELLGVVGFGFGLRTVARELLDLVPVAGWALKGAVAYAGTKAIGEAAVRYFDARS